MMFKLTEIKNYTICDLHKFKGLALASQGTGKYFSKMLENRITKIENELHRRFDL